MEAGFGTSNVMYETYGAMGANTHYHGFNFRLSGLSRPLRYFGLGVELTIPLAQSNSFAFPESRFQGQFAPSKMDYSFRNSVSGSVFGRLFYASALNAYLEVRVSFLSMTEKFVFTRGAVIDDYWGYNVPAQNIKFVDKHTLVIPGLALGIQPHLGKRIYLNFNVGLDFYRFDKSSFKYYLEKDFNPVSNNLEIGTVESKVKGTNSSFVLNLGLGYFF